MSPALNRVSGVPPDEHDRRSVEVRDRAIVLVREACAEFEVSLSRFRSRRGRRPSVAVPRGYRRDDDPLPPSGTTAVSRAAEAGHAGALRVLIDFGGAC